MTDRTRRSLVAALGVGLSSAGCLSNPLDWHGSESSDPSHAVSLRNDADDARTVRVWVAREAVGESEATGETVFETTREVTVGAEVELYDTRRADPEGVEAFRVCGELVGTPTPDARATGTTIQTHTTPDESRRRGCATIRTTECYGDAEVVVRDDDSLQVVYAVC